MGDAGSYLIGFCRGVATLLAGHIERAAACRGMRS